MLPPARTAARCRWRYSGPRDDDGPEHNLVDVPATTTALSPDARLSCPDTTAAIALAAALLVLETARSRPRGGCPGQRRCRRSPRRADATDDRVVRSRPDVIIVHPLYPMMMSSVIFSCLSGTVSHDEVMSSNTRSPRRDTTREKLSAMSRLPSRSSIDAQRVSSSASRLATSSSKPEMSGCSGGPVADADLVVFVVAQRSSLSCALQIVDAIGVRRDILGHAIAEARREVLDAVDAVERVDVRRRRPPRPKRCVRRARWPGSPSPRRGSHRRWRRVRRLRCWCARPRQHRSRR